ncbi:MAG: phosphoribosylformimino-5-aminoimidazole carboxamide ribotide isomerase [Desulfobacteraceae bacterium]
MRFRPCIDLHQGIVKQIIGGTLSDHNKDKLKTNFQAQKSASWFADLYRTDNLTGGHVIKLGPGNDAVAQEALKEWPNGLQVGGGITVDNATDWLNAGAAAVIVTSWVFYQGKIDETRLKHLSKIVGKEHLVLDLSCRKKDDHYLIVTDRWQTFTQEAISFQLLDHLSQYCCEYLIHAVDVEGRCKGIEYDLIALLGHWSGLPITYAGGIHTIEDIKTIDTLGRGYIDFTVGSALDIFGGNQLSYRYLADNFGPN